MKFIDDSKVPDHPYPELREVPGSFVDKIEREVGENLVGIYRVGSIASRDFDTDSDITTSVLDLQEARKMAVEISNRQGRKIVAPYNAKRNETVYL
jgi:hypothetical protein